MSRNGPNWLVVAGLLFVLAVSPVGPFFSFADYAQLFTPASARPTLERVDGRLRSVSLPAPTYVGVSICGKTVTTWVHRDSPYVSDLTAGLAEELPAKDLGVTLLEVRDAASACRVADPVELR